MLPMTMPRLSIQYDADLRDYAILDNEEGRFIAAARNYADATILLEVLAPYYPALVLPPAAAPSTQACATMRPWVIPIVDPADFDYDLTSGAVDAADKLAQMDERAFRELATEMVALSGEDEQTEETITLWLRQFMAQYALSEQVA